MSNGGPSSGEAAPKAEMTGVTVDDKHVTI